MGTHFYPCRYTFFCHSVVILEGAKRLKNPVFVVAFFFFCHRELAFSLSLRSCFRISSCHSGLVSESRPLSFIRLCEKGALATDAAIPALTTKQLLQENNRKVTLRLPRSFHSLAVTKREFFDFVFFFVCFRFLKEPRGNVSLKLKVIFLLPLFLHIFCLYNLLSFNRR